MRRQIPALYSDVQWQYSSSKVVILKIACGCPGFGPWSISLCTPWRFWMIINWVCLLLFSGKSGINARNHFLFWCPDKFLSIFSKQAPSFVHDYRAAQERDRLPGSPLPHSWFPLVAGPFQTQFWWWPLGLKWLILADAEQDQSFGGPNIEEARAYLLGLKCTKEVRIATLRWKVIA